MKEIIEFLKEERFNFVSNEDKDFIQKFDNEITKMGYDFGDKIGEGYCWGKYMIIYSKTGLKNKKVIARIYLRTKATILRLYFNKIDKHREYIESTPKYIKDVFTGDSGKCYHCHNEKNGKCKFRKSYTIDREYIEKCNGKTFEFLNPSVENLNIYIELLLEFYSSMDK